MVTFNTSSNTMILFVILLIVEVVSVGTFGTFIVKKRSIIFNDILQQLWLYLINHRNLFHPLAQKLITDCFCIPHY